MSNAVAPNRPPSSPTAIAALLDPSGLGPIPAVPLVPEEILRTHHVFIAADHRFKSAARLLQALYREDRNLPIGSFLDIDGKRKRLGSSINRQAGREGSNFLSPAIVQIVHRELVYRELGAMYDTARLRQNLLSSMPLAFNLFGLLKRDLAFARRVIAELLPGFMHDVTSVQFEHSPGRGNPRYTADHSAFDVIIRGTTRNGLRAFIAIEVKYTENMQDLLPRTFSERYTDLAVSSGLFADVDLTGLWRNPVQQLFREHCLAQTILDTDLADVGLFVLLAPALNHLAHEAAKAYATYLAPPRTGHAQFITLTIDRTIEAIAAAGLGAYAQQLHRRYLDFWQVDGELALEDLPDPFIDPPGTTAPSPDTARDTAPPAAE